MNQSSTNYYQVNNQQGTLPTYQPNPNIRVVQPSITIRKSTPSSGSTTSSAETKDYVELTVEEENRFYKSVRKSE